MSRVGCQKLKHFENQGDKNTFMEDTGDRTSMCESLEHKSNSPIPGCFGVKLLDICRGGFFYFPLNLSVKDLRQAVYT